MPGKTCYLLLTMNLTIYTPVFIGGLLIGTGASLLLLFNGRIAGLSGIINGILTPVPDDVLWRVVFFISLLAGAILHNHFVNPELYDIQDQLSPVVMIAGGFLVGFGTRIGSGCTSGHGVCGLGRLSFRSLVATVVFIFVAMLTVWFGRHLFSFI